MFGDRGEPVPVRAAQVEALSGATLVAPRVDVFASDAELLVRADIPGADATTAFVTRDGSRLVLGARPATPGSNGPSFEWYRELSLPSDCHTGKVDARIQDGVLSVRIPRDGSAKPRTIRVRAA